MVLFDMFVNVTVNCIATDGEHTVVKTIDIVVEAAIGNNPPSAGMSSEVDEYGVVTLDAGALSSDPDGDELLFKFNFGDGNWTDWIDESSASHHYSQTGTYNCSLRVRDIKGAVSERYYLLVNVDKVSGIGDDDVIVDDNDSDSGAPLILIIIAVAGIGFLLLLGIVILIIVVLRRKKGEDWEEEDEEEAESW